MGIIKLTEKPIGSNPSTNTHFVVTQPETVDGITKESVRRLKRNQVIDDTLSTAGMAADAKAVGDEIGVLKADLSDIENTYYDVSANLFNQDYSGTAMSVSFANGVAQNYILRSTGIVEPYEGTNISYPIEVEEGKTLYFYRINMDNDFVTATVPRLAFYDRNYAYIDKSYKAMQTSAVVPDGAKYMIGCAEYPSYQIFGNGVFGTVSYDSTLTEYVPYYKKVRINEATQRIEEVAESIPVVNSFNSNNIPEGYDWKTKVSEFCALFNDTDNVESFCFFTDPHLFLTGGRFQMDTLETLVSELQKVYNSAPCSFIVSGGDWINNGDTKAQACLNLGYVDGIMRSMFDRHYMLVGNHDTNYQGDAWIQDNTKYRECMLSNDTLKNLWFRDQGERYYSFDGNVAKYYVLDTGLDWWNWITEDRKAQIDWLAERLRTDDPAHATILMHMAANPLGEMYENAIAIGKIITAFNSHTTSEAIRESVYDFTSTTGHIDYVLSGHTHKDMLLTLGGVPLIITKNFAGDGVATFDLVLADYDKKQINLVRVGSGDNRTVAFV